LFEARGPRAKEKQMTKVGKMLLIVLGLVLLAVSGTAQTSAPGSFSGWSDVQAFGQWTMHSVGNTPSGSATMQLDSCYFAVQGGNSNIPSWFPLSVGVSVKVLDDSNGGQSETVPITAVATPSPSVGSSQPGYTCAFTATFTYAHSQGVRIVSADSGLGEALAVLNPAGGTVALTQGAIINATNMASVLPYPNVAIVDLRGPQLQYWTAQPTTLTALATPAPRVGTASTGCTGTNTVCDGTAVGTWTNIAIYFCVTYMDILGGESPCSTTAHYTTAGSLAINMLAPAASTGAVGWRAYIGSSYATAYQIPLTSANCTLTLLENVIPACAIANTTYGQAASNGVFPTPTTHTQIPPQAGGTAGAYNPNTISHTTFSYQPSRYPTPGFETSYGPFTISGALTAAQSVVVGTVPLPAGYLNYIGQSIRVTGKITFTDSTDTGKQTLIVALGDITDFSTGTPLTICTLTGTTVTAANAAYTQEFSCTLETNATGATGSIMPDGWITQQLSAGTTTGAAGVEQAAAAITADVLDQDSLFIVFTQTTDAQSTTPPHLLSLHLEPL